MDEQEKKITRD